MRQWAPRHTILKVVRLLNYESVRVSDSAETETAPERFERRVHPVRRKTRPTRRLERVSDSTETESALVSTGIRRFFGAATVPHQRRCQSRSLRGVHHVTSISTTIHQPLATDDTFQALMLLLSGRDSGIHLPALLRAGQPILAVTAQDRAAITAMILDERAAMLAAAKDDEDDEDEEDDEDDEDDEEEDDEDGDEEEEEEED